MSTPRYCRLPTALFRYTLRGVIIVPSAGHDGQLVTRPGDSVWALLEEPISLPALVTTLGAVFDADDDDIRDDVAELLDDLIALGAVEEVDETGDPVETAVDTVDDTR